MLIYRLIFYSAHPPHSDRCEAIEQHSRKMRQGQRARQKYDKEEKEKQPGRKLRWRPDEWSWYCSLSAFGQGGMQPLGTVVESLNTELEVAIHYPQPRRLTATAVAERQRWAKMPPCGNTFGPRECLLVKREEEKQRRKVGWRSDELSRHCSPDYHGLEGLQTCTNAQMPPYQAFTFTPERVNILVLFLVTCFILATSRIHACAFSFLLTDNRYSAFNRDSSYLSLE